MKDQSQMMSMSQQLPQVMNNNQNSQMFVNQLMNPSQMMVNQLLNRRGIGGGSGGGGGGGYGMWPPSQVDQMKFQNPNLKPSGLLNPSGLLKPLGIRNNKNWKMKKGNDKWNNNNNSGSSIIGSGVVGGVYNPPTLNELQQQNRLKAKRYFPKKKYNHGGGGGRKAPFAPRNTTSFLIRAKKAGGITSLVSPCPVTPAVLPTPIFSPSREVLVDMAKEEWGVDGYGSMKGLIRLRSPGNEADVVDDDEEDEGGSSESDVEEHVEVERRLDHDLSRFEMIYPNYSGTDHNSYNLENIIDDQDTHIAQLEEENLILKERMFLMEREFDDLRMHLQCLERQSRGVEPVNHKELVENDSENESESRGYGQSLEEKNERSQNWEDNNNIDALGVVATDVHMEEDIQKTQDVESAEALIETNVAGSNNEEIGDANEPANEEESAENGL